MDAGGVIFERLAEPTLASFSLPDGGGWPRADDMRPILRHLHAVPWDGMPLAGTRGVV